jgi:hypothetical protein
MKATKDVKDCASRFRDVKESKHYGKTIHCRATIRTAKALICPAKVLPCVDARQRLHGNASDGNEDIAVRQTKPHGKGLYRARQRCRAAAPLPCA